MYEFVTIKIKKATANKFRVFAKKLSKSQTDTLDLMLTFFVENGISPKRGMGSTIHTLEDLVKKRVNGLVAIIKDIEKHQTQPTNAMLQLLFEQTPPKQKKPRLVEVKQVERKSKDHSFATSLEAIELRKEKNTIKRDLKETKQQFEELLFSKINIVKSSFGKPRLRLDMSVEELEALKEKIKNTWLCIFPCAEVYLVMEIENKSGIDFEIDYLNI